MGTPNRTSLMLEIKSTLEGISSADGYKSTVICVEPWLRSRDDVLPGERPYLGFGFDLEPYEHQLHHNMRVQVPWLVVGYINTAPWEQMSSELNNLIDDIITIVMANHKFSGYAQQTEVVSSQTDEFDPDRGTGGACFVEFKSIYYRNTTAS
jgi:hypothetical protein